jgi:dTDP-4-dehydrorhamnose reductase
MANPVLLPPEALPLLITGCAGVPGYNAFYHLSAQYPGSVFGIRGTQTWKLQEPNIYPLDIEDHVALKSLFQKHRFRSVLDASGTCALKICELRPHHARLVNIQGLQSLLSAIDSLEPTAEALRLIRLSSDLVFSGRYEGNYKESDPPDPVTVYGETMASAEALLQHHRPSTLILRISLPMGESFNGHAGAIDWISHRFKRNKPATLYFDEVRTPTYTRDMEELYCKLFSLDLHGIYHAGGLRALSLYEIAQIINKVGGYPPVLLKGCSRYEAGPLPPRAGNVTLNSTPLYQALQSCPFRPWPALESLIPDTRDWHEKRDSTFQGSPEKLIEYLC